MADRSVGVLALTIHTTQLGGDMVLVELNRTSERGASVIVPLEVPEPWMLASPEEPDGG